MATMRASKLPLLPLLWCANAVDEISVFPIYPFTNDLLSQFINFGIMKKSQLCALVPTEYFIIPTIYYNIHNLLCGPNFSWSLILRFLVIRSSLSAR